MQRFHFHNSQEQAGAEFLPPPSQINIYCDTNWHIYSFEPVKWFLSTFFLLQFFERLQLFEEESKARKQELNERTLREIKESLEKKLAGQHKLSKREEQMYDALKGMYSICMSDHLKDLSQNHISLNRDFSLKCPIDFYIKFKQIIVLFSIHWTAWHA